MGAGETTAASFPTYADLTQTAGWTKSPPSIVGFEPTSPVEDPELIRYTERALLGQGGMGKVTLAHDARVGRDVAVKQLHGNRELAPEERVRFLREARVQGQLEHPSIVPVYDIDQRSDGTTFFTMRRVQGRTLHAILEDLRVGAPVAVARYTQRELLTAFATICLTVDYAHSRGVVHRDLKPANIMLGDFGEVYVLDWGLARVVEDEATPSSEVPERLSMSGELLGTPLYMAPEQMADPAVGAAADVFSLGAILFEILTLDRLRDPRSIYEPPDARTSVRSPSRDIAPELETICVRATEVDPEDRFASPRELQASIARYLEGDRDREQRTMLAARHAARAKEAMVRAQSEGIEYERQRGIALRELARAVALDPRNSAYVDSLATTLAMPPRELPPEVQAQLRKETDRIVKSGASHSVWGMLSWFAFLPVVLAIGVVDQAALGWIVVTATLGLVLSVVASRQRVIGRGIQIAILFATLAAVITVSRVYGPLILMPTLVISYAITLQAHPWRFFRRLGLAAAVVAMGLPVLLEVAGWFPTSYSFVAGRMIVEPQVVALSQTGTVGLLAVANITMLVVPALFIAKLRADLSLVQTRQLVQTWQFRRLGDELVAAKS
ncbi:MAG: serine/threonine-protein kinase [Kofleriaceae bacterium]